jgi:hypothetical protein
MPSNILPSGPIVILSQAEYISLLGALGYAHDAFKILKEFPHALTIEAAAREFAIITNRWMDARLEREGSSCNA